ncbi:Farnesyl diphosphate synthase [invertebrate metagenome]|uniref:Farnesyl diphosphate synthase n=1 Tax=invertebrate metagenome TaxID=1711999 RepID=A0A2H9T593_9ZZZZ
MSLEQYFDECRHRVNGCIRSLLSAHDSASLRLTETMAYSANNGGKRIRPILVYAASHSLGGEQRQGDIPACAIELMHTYSLIHDDLPAMDNDALRRGQPANHKVYGDAMAILAGDALQTLAFEVLSNTDLFPDFELSTGSRLSMVRILAKASGYSGMAAGQAIDLEAVGLQLNQDALENMHAYKTGALIRASVRLGGLACVQQDDPRLDALDNYAKAIGLAFQVQDDILDVTAETQTIGKPQGADAELNKPTYVSILGLDKAQSMAAFLCQSAVDALSEFDSRADYLRELADFIIHRES